MNLDNMSFEIDDRECDILKVIPINHINYVIFTDYSLDDNNESIEYFGKVSKTDGEYELEVITDESIISQIKNNE